MRREAENLGWPLATTKTKNGGCETNGQMERRQFANGARILIVCSPGISNDFGFPNGASLPLMGRSSGARAAGVRSISPFLRIVAVPPAFFVSLRQDISRQKRTISGSVTCRITAEPARKGGAGVTKEKSRSSGESRQAIVALGHGSGWRGIALALEAFGELRGCHKTGSCRPCAGVFRPQGPGLPPSSRLLAQDQRRFCDSLLVPGATGTARRGSPERKRTKEATRSFLRDSRTVRFGPQSWRRVLVVCDSLILVWLGSSLASSQQHILGARHSFLASRPQPPNPNS